MTEDPRRVIERAMREALLAELERLRAQLDPDSHRNTEPWAQRLFEQRDAAVAEVEHLRAERNEARAGRERLRKLAAAMLSTFTEKGHPGRPCLRSGWVDETTVVDWHRTYRELS